MNREIFGIGIKTAVLSIVIVFFIGGLALGATAVFGPMFKDQERIRFEHSVQHKQAVVKEFADRCAELATTTDPEAKKALTVVIAQTAVTENLDELQMSSQVRSCVDNAVTKYINGDYSQ